MKRARIVKWMVQPVVMVDDGDNLHELNVEAVAIPAAEWETFCATGWREAVEHIRAQVETPDDPAE